MAGKGPFKSLSDIDKLVERPLTAVEEQRLLDEIIDQAVEAVVSETITEVEEEEELVGSGPTLPDTLRSTVEICVEIADAGSTIVMRRANVHLEKLADWLRDRERSGRESSRKGR